MRWKWKLGLLLIAAMESPILLWTGFVLRMPAEILGTLAAILTAVLTGMLAVRPVLFALTGIWLLGIAGSALYLLRYLPPSLALGLGSVLSTVGCAVGFPVYSQAIGFVLRHHT